MKWQLLIITALMMIPIVTALQECEEVVTPNDVPCQVFSTFQYNNCTLTQSLIYNTTPTLISTRNWSVYGGSGRCNFTWNVSSIGSYFWNSTGDGETGRIIVENESDNMASLAIMLFVMAITFIMFKIAGKVRFTNNEVANHILRNCMYLAGVWMLLLTLSMAITISNTFGLGVNSELLRIFWFAHKGAYIFSLILVWSAIHGGLSLWNMKKQKQRMGQD